MGKVYLLACTATDDTLTCMFHCIDLSSILYPFPFPFPKFDNVTSPLCSFCHEKDETTVYRLPYLELPKFKPLGAVFDLCNLVIRIQKIYY